MPKLKNKIISWLMARFNVGRVDRFISRTPILNIFYKFFVQKTINGDFPTHLFIESTSLCNFRCKMCPRTAGDTLMGNMDFAVFKKIIDESKQYGPRSFCLHLFGEPLLAPKIIDMIKYIKESDAQNTILLTTNGALLNREKSEELVKCGVDKISVSFTSPDKNVYFEKTGVNKLEEVENNIEQLISIKKSGNSKKPLIFVRMIVEQDTENQAEDFIKKWKGKDVIFEVRDMHNYGGNIDKTHVKNNSQRYPCYHLWLSPAIHWNGDVSVCCNDYKRDLLLGNIKNQTLNEIWTGPKINHYRKLHLEGKYDKMPLCEKCDVWNIYSDLFFSWQKK